MAIFGRGAHKAFFSVLFNLMSSSDVIIEFELEVEEIAGVYGSSLNGQEPRPRLTFRFAAKISWNRARTGQLYTNCESRNFQTS